MTSSVTSTEKGLVPRDPSSEPPAVGPAAGPPASRRGVSADGRQRLALTAFTVLPALGIVAIMYGGSLTVGALFLGLGWVSFALAAWHLGRAALAFDVTPGAIDPGGDLDAERRSELNQEKKTLLKAIKEIEFDHAMGKVDDRDAAEITATYRARALEIIRLLDEAKATDYAVVVEKELAKRLAKAGGLAQKELPAAGALAREVDTGASADTSPECAACGTRNDQDALFCKKCGAKVSA